MKFYTSFVLPTTIVLMLSLVITTQLKAQNAYITRNDTVSVINTATNSVIANIQTSSTPDAVIISPDGSKAFITYYANKKYLLSVINTNTNTVSANIPIPNQSLGADGIEISPDGSRLYVPSIGLAGDTVFVISSSDYTSIAKIALPTLGSVEGIVANSAGTYIYVAAENKIFVINALNNTLVKTISITAASAFYGIAITPDGNKIYAADYSKNTVYVVNTNNDEITSIATGTGSQPWGVVISYDGATVYITDYRKSLVYLVNATTNVITKTIPVGSRPYGLALTPDGKKLFTASAGSKYVYSISTTTNTVADSIFVGGASFAFGKFVGPQPGRLCPNGSTNLTSNLSGSQYQWQVSTDSINFTNISDDANYTGSNSMILKISNVLPEWYGYLFRCNVDGQSGNVVPIQIENNWLGTYSSLWENNDNWGCRTTPGATTDVLINHGSLVLNSDGNCRSIIVQPGASFTTNPAATLNVSGRPVVDKKNTKIRIEVKDANSWTAGSNDLKPAKQTTVKLYLTADDVAKNNPVYSLVTNDVGVVETEADYLDGYYLIAQNGTSSNLYNGYLVEGVFLSQQEVASAPYQSNPPARVGGVRLSDVNRDGVINTYDKTIADGVVPVKNEIVNKTIFIYKP